MHNSDSLRPNGQHYLYLFDRSRDHKVTELWKQVVDLEFYTILNMRVVY